MIYGGKALHLRRLREMPVGVMLYRYRSWRFTFSSVGVPARANNHMLQLHAVSHAMN